MPCCPMCPQQVCTFDFAAWSNDAAIPLARGHAVCCALRSKLFVLCCLPVLLPMLWMIHLISPDLAGTDM